MSHAAIAPDAGMPPASDLVALAAPRARRLGVTAALGWGGFLLALWALLCWMAPPGYYWGDSAELAATTWLMSNSHPTSYPLFAPILKLAGYWPGVSLGFAQNLAHQFLLWLSLWLLGAAGCLWTGQRGALWWVATLGVGGAWLGQAMGLEVYPLWMLLLALTFFTASRWVALGRPASLLGATLLFALMGWQFPLCVLLLPLAAGVWVARLGQVRQFFRFGPVAAVTAMALVWPGSPYVAVVLRGAARPALNWGRADNPVDLFHHLSLSEYGVGLPQRLAELPDRLGGLDLWAQFGPFLVVALALLAAGFWGRWRKLWWWLLAVLPFVLFTGLIHHGDPAALRLPALVAFCGAVAWGASRWLGRLSPLWFGLALGVWTLLVGHTALPRFITHDDTPMRLALATLRGLPKRAVLIMAGEPRLSVVQALQTLHGVRPDVVVIPESHMGVRWAYEQGVKKAPWLKWPPFPGTGKLGLFAPANIDFQSKLVLQNIGQQRFFLTYHFHHLIPPLFLRPRGVVMEALMTDRTPEPAGWRDAPLGGVLGATPGPYSKQVVAHVERQSGLSYLGQGRPDLALDHFENAHALWPDEMEQALNLGTAHNGVAMGYPVEATSLAIRVLEERGADEGEVAARERELAGLLKSRRDHLTRADVYYQEAEGLGGGPPVWYNRALLLIDRAKTALAEDPRATSAQDDLDDAARLLTRAIGRAEGRTPAAYQALGSVYWLLKLPQDAEDAWLQALELNPAYFAAHRSLAELYLSQNRFREGVRLIERIEALAPNLLSAQLFAGEKYLSLRLTDRAARCYRRAAALSPLHPQVKAFGQALRAQQSGEGDL